MKRFIIAAFALFLTAVSSFAALPTSGAWNPLTTGATSRRVDSQTVTLTGSVDLNCTIIVGSGRTLTIENGTTSAVGIYNKVGPTGRSHGMFLVEAGGKLIIKGKNGARITLGGGGNFADPTYSTGVISANSGIIDNVGALVINTNTIEMKWPAIFNCGEVQLEYTNIQNVCNSGTSGNADPTKTSGGTGGAVLHAVGATLTKMDNCTVKNILAYTGAGVYACDGTNGQIVISNSNFYNCIDHNTGTGLHGGIIRGFGTSGTNISLTKVNVHHCYSASDAGAMYFPSNAINTTGTTAFPATNNPAVLTFDGCNFYNNCSETRSGALDICANLTLTGSATKVHDNYAKGNSSKTYEDIGGGVSFRAYNSGSPAPNPVDVLYNASNLLEVCNNKAKRGGGIAFYAADDISLQNGSTFTLNVDGAKIHDNESMYGGGIWMRNDDEGEKGYEFTLQLNSGEVYDNTANYGGGMFIYKWDVESSTSGTIQVYRNHAVKLSDGTAGTGGGIYLNKSTYEMNSGTIGGLSGGNKAEYSVGGIYLCEGSSFTFNGGEVSYNETDGFVGGIMVNTNSTAVFNGGSIKNNQADGETGGVRVTNNSEFTFAGTGDISYNRSGGIGGGVSVLNGATFTFSGTGKVEHNKAAKSGGGIYCNASTVDFTNGECIYNEAGEAGGGVCCVQRAEVTFTGNIKNNTAKRGGGISLNTGSTFTMEGGVISSNNATCLDPLAPTTTYGGGNNGFGGGVVLINKDESSGSAVGTTTLVINVSETTPFGLYGNNASIGGNDITSSGVGTSVTIPNVKSMELAGFSHADASPNWYEDYNAADANYNQGTNLDAATNARYSEQLIANTYLKHLVSFIGDSHTYTNYLNLTLGYELLHIILTVTNLAEGETALFNLSYAPTTGPIEKTWPILLIGTGETTVSKTIRNLNYGRYEAGPVGSWQWKYSVINPVAGYYSESVLSGPEKVFEFTLSRDDKNLETDEKNVVNKIQE